MKLVKKIYHNSVVKNSVNCVCKCSFPLQPASYDMHYMMLKEQL
ncbi:hypothetical protein PV797_04330 [Clostridiaceae bacterium M8S5]|nr:hypothetical protein PV797_04330 [Clostridiaceae bacterium M8S5]